MSTIQDLFRDHRGEYFGHFGDCMPAMHSKVVDAICDCRSGACGHHLFACPDCHRHYVANSSCGNRHCPVCQNEKAGMWVYRQQLRLLPCNYFMATFTMPEGLRAVARGHQRVVYDAMFNEAAASLRTLEADKRFVGCKVAGFFGVLHTWGRQLQYHPHVHFVVPGGGLSQDRNKWVASSGHFLVHVRALSRMYRGKMKAALREAGLLDEVPEEVWQKEWVVHCKAVGDGRHTMKYLGAYIFRVAISNARIIAYDEVNVTFKYQKVGSSKWRKMTLPAIEFMRRYLQHVLPKGFVKVRHFGFLSPNFGMSIQRIRELICVLYELLRKNPVRIKPPNKPKPLRCARCSALMKWMRFLPPTATARSP